MPGEFEGKTALVTGASRGIGRAIAKRLAASGALVAAHYGAGRKEAEEVVAAIQAAGGQAFTVQADFNKSESIGPLVEALEVEFTQRTGSPALDFLINNAGAGGFVKIEDTSDEYYDSMFAVNTRAPFFLVKALMPRLRRDGSVINISSAGVRIALPETAAYIMAKAAQDNFTKVMAKQLGPLGVRVNTVAPGFTETDGTADFLADPAARKRIEDLTPVGRIAQPEDIAELVHALLTPAGAFVTGQLIDASGGYLL